MTSCSQLLLFLTVMLAIALAATATTTVHATAAATPTLKRLWNRTAAPGVLQFSTTVVSSDGSKVFTTFGATDPTTQETNFFIAALDGQTGETIWQQDMKHFTCVAQYESLNTMWQHPTLGILVFQCAVSINAVSMKDGEKLWSIIYDPSSIPSPSPFRKGSANKNNNNVNDNKPKKPAFLAAPKHDSIIFLQFNHDDSTQSLTSVNVVTGKINWQNKPLNWTLTNYRTAAAQDVFLTLTFPVITSSLSGDLTGYDTKTGALLFINSNVTDGLNEPALPLCSGSGSGSNAGPEGIVVTTPQGPTISALNGFFDFNAFDVKTGAHLWTWKLAAKNEQVRVVSDCSLEGGTVLMITTSLRVVALNVATAKMQWEFDGPAASPWLMFGLTGAQHLGSSPYVAIPQSLSAGLAIVEVRQANKNPGTILKSVVVDFPWYCYTTWDPPPTHVACGYPSSNFAVVSASSSSSSSSTSPPPLFVGSVQFKNPRFGPILNYPAVSVPATEPGKQEWLWWDVSFGGFDGAPTVVWLNEHRSDANPRKTVLFQTYQQLVAMDVIESN